jgi:acyl-CoA thioester hydrolase
MTQDIVDDEGRVCCAAKFLIGLFDLTARKLIDPTPAWKKALGIDAE